MSAVSRRSDRYVASNPPPACLLCGPTRFDLRFPASTSAPSTDPAAFRCTSFAHHVHGAIWECATCGLVMQWPQPADTDLEAAYRAVEDPLYTAERENRYLTFRRVVRALGPGDGRRLLDIGAYCGYFLDVAREAGFAAEGVELSTWAADEARALEFTVHQQRLHERAAAGDRYDVVTMWDVLEHLADPIGELEAVAAMLRPGGRLYLSTVDVHSAAARAMGGRWPWLMEMHLVYFDRATVRAALERTGLHPVSTHTYTHVVSARYLLQKATAMVPAAARLLARLADRTPERWRVPVNLGDNLLVVAERVD